MTDKYTYTPKYTYPKNLLSQFGICCTHKSVGEKKQPVVGSELMDKTTDPFNNYTLSGRAANVYLGLIFFIAKRLFFVRFFKL